jgi:hypothetical protein
VRQEKIRAEQHVVVQVDVAKAQSRIANFLIPDLEFAEGRNISFDLVPADAR